jgi:hypothetical protein
MATVHEGVRLQRRRARRGHGEADEPARFAWRDSPLTVPAAGLSNQAMQRSLRAGNVPLALVATHGGALGNRALGRVLGNQPTRRQAAVQRLPATALAEPETATPDAEPTPSVDTDQLVGLRENDGMTTDTINIRPRVVKLQERLNLKMNAGLKPDGKFGKNTLRALNDFQKSHELPTQNEVDADTAGALTDRVKPEPQPGPLPGPKPTPINPLLEDKLDEAMANYQIMLLRARDGLTALERDLSKKRDPSFGKKLLLAAIEGALEFVLGPAHGLLSVPIKETFERLAGPEIEPTPTPTDPNAHKHHHENLVKAGITEVLAKMLEKSVETGVHEAETLIARKAPSVDAFIDGQREALLDAHAVLQETFLSETKNMFRTEVPGAPSADKEPKDDPRLKKADGLVKGIKAGQGGARDDQYTASLAEWSSALAQSNPKLGSQEVEVEDPLDPNKKKKQQVTKLTGKSARDAADGVLRVTIDNGLPEFPMNVTKVELTGLPEPALRKLEKRGGIGRLNLPRQATGKVEGGLVLNGPRHGQRLEGEIFITKNEVGDPNDIGGDADGHDWLVQKAMANGIATKDMMKAGAAIAWNEIDKHKLSDNEIKS